MDKLHRFPTNETRNQNRRPAVAGRFYPGSPSLLQNEVIRLLKEAKPRQQPVKLPLSLIVPHAGYIYSGITAASAYNQLGPDPEIDKVFILASSHRMNFPGASVYCSGDFETPLGTVGVDHKTADKLILANSLFSCREDAHQFEHSLEVQIPFLQIVLKKSFQIIPIVLGTQSIRECALLAETLSHYMTGGNLIVVSSDFSHYPAYDDAIEIDRTTTQAIMANDPHMLMETLEQNKRKEIPGLATSLCGWAAVLTLLYITYQGNYHFNWIDYKNSGDHAQFGDRDRVVGYSAIAVYEK